MTDGRPLTAVKQARTAQGLRLVDVAGEAKVSIGLLSMIENGYIPKNEVRERIAHALGRSSGTLWPGMRGTA